VVHSLSCSQRAAANPQTKDLDFEGFDSSRFLLTSGRLPLKELDPKKDLDSGFQSPGFLAVDRPRFAETQPDRVASKFAGPQGIAAIDCQSAASAFGCFGGFGSPGLQGLGASRPEGFGPGRSALGAEEPRLQRAPGGFLRGLRDRNSFGPFGPAGAGGSGSPGFGGLGFRAPETSWVPSLRVSRPPDPPPVRGCPSSRGEATLEDRGSFRGVFWRSTCEGRHLEEAVAEADDSHDLGDQGQYDMI